MTHFAASSAGYSARLLVGGLVTILLQPLPVLAQATPSSDPLVAKVDGQPLYLSDLRAAAESLPDNARAMPPDRLYPMLLDQLINGRALSAEARRIGMEKDPMVLRQMQAASDRVLETALLQKEVGPDLTDDALRARYDREMAGKKGADEVHARHILVDDEATAKMLIADLKKGGDFAALSAKFSKDPGAKSQGGDLGFFRRDDMVPEFAAAAFALKDGEVTPDPVRTQFGWHVIQVLGRRQGDPQSFDQARDTLRQQAIQEGVQKVIARAVAAARVERFNLDGSVPKATDMAVPPAR